jgi:hypothetical protein
MIQAVPKIIALNEESTAFRNTGANCQLNLPQSLFLKK